MVAVVAAAAAAAAVVDRSVLGKAAPQLICSLGNILFFINCFCCCCCCVDDGSFSGGFVRVPEELHRWHGSGGDDPLGGRLSVRPSVWEAVWGRARVVLGGCASLGFVSRVRVAESLLRRRPPLVVCCWCCYSGGDIAWLAGWVGAIGGGDE